ncbi:hypothetical protein IW261DRAFT_1609777 [Armillaria novae-zelandiae]|uniref:Uncharacterized protein n=1 Tax=Armillaria novae-zelandiae TaxID=153914 RepID=A0AA39P284_9AGAR|nr:hypothetical protein IW261DRAFT_1609777 [Armillaria novae-zelandiae]
MSQWTDTVASAVYTLQNHSYLLIWAWEDFSRLLADISMPMFQMSDMLRAKTFLKSFQTSFLGGLSELVKMQRQINMPPNYSLRGALGTLQQNRTPSINVSTAHSSSVDAASSSQASVSFTESAASHSPPFLPDNIHQPRYHRTNSTNAVVPRITPKVATSTSSPSPELCDSSTSVSTESSGGDNDNGTNSLEAQVVSRPLALVTPFHMEPSDPASRAKSSNPSYHGNATSYVSHASPYTRSEKIATNDSFPHQTSTTEASVSVSSTTMVNTFPSPCDMPEPEQSTRRGATLTSRRRSVYHSQDADNGDRLTSLIAISATKVSAGSAKSRSKSKHRDESCLAATRAKTKTS